MKTAVVYWSGTGNTEAMARAVAEGMTAAGAEAVLLTPAEVAPGDLNTYGAIAFGCPAMGSEVLEEMEFQHGDELGPVGEKYGRSHKSGALRYHVDDQLQSGSLYPCR